MFPWKDYLMGRIRNIQKHKEKRDRSGKLKKKNKKETVEQRKRRDFDAHGGSHTRVFSIGRNAPGLPPSGEPTHMGTSPTTSKFVLVQCRLAFLHLRQW